MANDSQVVDEVHDETSAETTAQVADPVATRRRTEGVGSSKEVVAVAVAAAAEHKQVVLGGAQAESSADNKLPRTIHPAATGRPDDVSPSKQVASVAVVAAADHKEANDGVQHEASGENTDQAAQPSTTRKKDLGSCSQVAAVVVEVGVGVRVEVKPAMEVEVEVAEPSSPLVPAIPTVSNIAADQKALARARLGSLLLVLINKFRMSKAAREQLKDTQNVATKAVKEASDQSSSEQSAADLAEVLTAKAKAEGLEPAVAARAFAEECAQRVAERERLEERIRIEVIKEVDDRAEELSIKKVRPVPLCVF